MKKVLCSRLKKVATTSHIYNVKSCLPRSEKSRTHTASKVAFHKKFVVLVSSAH